MSLRRRKRRGFTLLEIMVAVAILGLGLTAILSAQAGAFAAASHARHVSQATGLARCKMLEVEEDTLRNGFQATDSEADGPCCDGDESIPMHCVWRVEAPVLPTPEYGQMDLASNFDPSSLGALATFMQPGGSKDMFASGGSVTDVANQLFGAAAAAPAGASTGAGDADGGMPIDPNAPPGASGNPMDQLSGLLMGMVYPDLKTYFEGSTRRLTVEITWREGSRNYSFQIEQWLAQPQQGIPDDDDDSSSTSSGTAGSTTGGDGTGGKKNTSTGSGKR
jgi:general secretion pathway protein I